MWEMEQLYALLSFNAADLGEKMQDDAMQKCKKIFFEVEESDKS